MNVFLVSLGCDKNLVDSEVMLSLIKEAGHVIVDDESIAEAVIINTCCFIHDAKEESIRTILEMAEWKKNGCLKKLIITGCLAQRYKHEIVKELPEVDVLLGTAGFTNIVTALSKDNHKDRTGSPDTDEVFFSDINHRQTMMTNRLPMSTSAYGYLKIAEGCDKHCTYCVIPQIRGRYQSVPKEEILKQAEQLASFGVKELILIAQETTVYGLDLYGYKALPELLRELCKIDGPEWIRIMYCYPEEISDELIEVIRTEKKICKYLDMPIQHASDTVLKRMGRKTTKKEIEALIERLRTQIPGIVIRTTMITGFPGETEGDFEELKDFVRTIRFDRLGVFPYSKEENTPAAKMKPQVPEKIKKQRRDSIMKIQQEIAFANAKNNIGKVLYVQVEGYLREDDVVIGRSYMDAPNVDGYVFFQSETELLAGTFVEVEVIAANGYDLEARPVQTEF